ncbi:MAG: methionyl-tRNA formyltransferase [Pseudomonadota bacterium]|nr:methionyl-tRNA formyltransferase [Pseudomonadota bacterium]MDE3038828.1 methionyl-tRNA formyltransferase [Pseudomonadota bacterium]
MCSQTFNSLSIVFMGTPEFAVPSLRALREAGHKIIAVYTQPPRPAGRGQKETPSPVQAYALAHNLPVFTPESLKTPEVQSQFASHRADVAVVVAYGLLLPKPILEAHPLGCVNVHPSLLPRWRGAAPIQRAIMAGDKETAVTLMQMDEGLDTGDMLLVEKYPIPEGMNAGALHDILAEKAGPLLLKTLQGLADKTIMPVKQPDTGVGYAKKITKGDCRIDWNQPAEIIYHQILGLSPSPGAFFIYKGEHIKIFEAEAWEKPTPYRHYVPGRILDERGTMIICGEGILVPEAVQRPGKKQMTYDEMLRGYPIPSGTILE